METLKENEKEILNNVCKYLQIGVPELTSEELHERIKEICVARLCASIGIKCKCNYQTKFFQLFSSISGEAVCQMLDIKLHIAEDCFRLFKFENVNLVEKVKEFLQNEDKDEAFVDIFHFLDGCKDLIAKYKKV